MSNAQQSRGEISGPAAVLTHLERHDIQSIAQVLARAQCVRDLPTRANYVLQVGGERYFIKRSKRGEVPPAEASALRRCQDVGVPTATLAFEGVDPELGSVTATLDLAPWRPADDLLREQRLSPAARRRVLRALAQAVAALHEARRHHRDLYLNHVFADPDGEGGVALIDLERSGRHRRTLGRRVVKDLAALLSSLPPASVTTNEQLSFLCAYLAARDLSLRPLRKRLVARIERKARRIAARTPRTPVGEAARPRGVKDAPESSS